MTRAFIGAALAVALLGSVSAYAAETPATGGTTAPATTTDTPPTPPKSLHCKAPKVPTQVAGKNGAMTWKCQKPAAAPTTPAPQ